jgi:hypothetical protein
MAIATCFLGEQASCAGSDYSPLTARDPRDADGHKEIGDRGKAAQEYSWPTHGTHPFGDLVVDWIKTEANPPALPQSFTLKQRLMHNGNPEAAFSNTRLSG